MIILETERTYLRTFNDSDISNLSALHFDSEVMRFLVGGVRENQDQVHMDLKKYIDHQNEYGFSKWAVIHKDTQDFMGRAGLIRIPETDEIDLGYALHTKYWNQGYATEIAKGLYGEALKHCKYNQVVGLVEPRHKASARVLEKIGFMNSGNGSYFGMVMDTYKPKFRIQVCRGFEVEEQVNGFYESMGRASRVDSADRLVIATIANEIVGVVRLCFENSCYVLRTMQIRLNYQKQGIGFQILKEFERLLAREGIEQIYCFAYAHLEKFYGSIGFAKIDFSQGPLFLQDRLRDSLRKHPNQSYILMVRGTELRPCTPNSSNKF